MPRPEKLKKGEFKGKAYWLKAGFTRGSSGVDGNVSVTVLSNATGMGPERRAKYVTLVEDKGDSVATIVHDQESKTETLSVHPDAEGILEHPDGLLQPGHKTVAGRRFKGRAVGLAGEPLNLGDMTRFGLAIISKGGGYMKDPLGRGGMQYAWRKNKA